MKSIVSAKKIKSFTVNQKYKVEKTNKPTQHVLLLLTKGQEQERVKMKRRKFQFLELRVSLNNVPRFVCMHSSVIRFTKCSVLKGYSISKHLHTIVHLCQQHNPEGCQLFAYNGKILAALWRDCPQSNIVPEVRKKNEVQMRMQKRKTSGRGKRSA